jgi:hypothetical protein
MVAPATSVCLNHACTNAAACHHTGLFHGECHGSTSCANRTHWWQSVLPPTLQDRAASLSAAPTLLAGLAAMQAMMLPAGVTSCRELWISWLADSQALPFHAAAARSFLTTGPSLTFMQAQRWLRTSQRQLLQQILRSLAAAGQQQALPLLWRMPPRLLP